MKNQLDNTDLSGLPIGFTVSYDGNTYPLPTSITSRDDMEDTLSGLFDQNGIPTDTHIVLTAPNGDQFKVGPDQIGNLGGPDDQADAASRWVSDEMLQFVSHPARKQSRRKQVAA